MQSRMAAASATVRVTTPSTAMPNQPGARAGTRPRLGFRPTRPQHEAGIRIDPPPSLAWATGNIPAATAAAAPPLEPPGVRLRVPRVAGDAVAGVLGHRERSELGGVGPPAQDEAGGPQELGDELALGARPRAAPRRSRR